MALDPIGLVDDRQPAGARLHRVDAEHGLAATEGADIDVGPPVGLVGRELDVEDADRAAVDRQLHAAFGGAVLHRQVEEALFQEDRPLELVRRLEIGDQDLVFGRPGKGGAQYHENN